MNRLHTHIHQWVGRRNRGLMMSVLMLAFVIAMVNVLPVVLGFMQTPEGTVYMGTGHYYLDYYYYLQQIGQGINGQLIGRQMSALDDPDIYLHMSPYLLIGQMSRLLQMGPVIAYWSAVVVLTTLYICLCFLFIHRLNPKLPSGYKLAACMLGLIATPFVGYDEASGMAYALYDYWYAPSNFFQRLAPVPHHMMGNVLTLIAMMVTADTLGVVRSLSGRSLLLRGLLVSMLTLTVMLFYPFLTVIFLCGLMLTLGWYCFRSVLNRDRYRLAVLIMFGAMVGAIAFLGGMGIRAFYYSTVNFSMSKGAELGYNINVPIDTFLLNLGPIFFLMALGVVRFAKGRNPYAMVILGFVVASFVLYMSDIYVHFDTHRGRFLSSITYLLYGYVGMLGISQITRWPSRLRHHLFAICVLLLVAYSIPVNLRQFQNKMHDTNLFTQITYLPSGILEGWEAIKDDKDDRGVLTAPSQFLGIAVPAFTHKRVYIARHFYTPHYEEKAYRSDHFFRGDMGTEEAKEFFKEEGIGYVTFSSIEGYIVDDFATYDFTKGLFAHYPFLTEFHRNSHMVVYKVPQILD